MYFKETLPELFEKDKNEKSICKMASKVSEGINKFLWATKSWSHEAVIQILERQEIRIEKHSTSPCPWISWIENELHQTWWNHS